MKRFLLYDKEFCFKEIREKKIQCKDKKMNVKQTKKSLRAGSRVCGSVSSKQQTLNDIQPFGKVNLYGKKNFFSLSLSFIMPNHEKSRDRAHAHIQSMSRIAYTLPRSFVRSFVQCTAAVLFRSFNHTAACIACIVECCYECCCCCYRFYSSAMSVVTFSTMVYYLIYLGVLVTNETVWLALWHGKLCAV